MTQQANVDGFFITRAEIDHLKEKLDAVVHPDLLDAMYAALAADASMGGIAGGGGGHKQQHSKPPYAMHIDALIDELHNELTTVIRDMCETRKIEVPDIGGATQDAARWLIRYRFGLALMEEAPLHYRHLTTVIDKCLRSVNQLQPEYRVTPAKVEAANRQVVTARQVEKLARQLGDEGRGLTVRRVKYLREHDMLTGTKDHDSDTWFYHLGDVIAAHKRARENRARPKVDVR
ncbi:hypothetical protein [Gordonia soli]|uniref:Uncharacterized protein n=1 Tax=Gordonia soli NBRC 108243 TaxID=1223545 RepID=M0QRM8_9ACTN|nr:hypothetical protein [Gordonia soli]GAC71016.1 hypothetical protein GS4_47_00050 [Gordonia soli NBRC 108243]